MNIKTLTFLIIFIIITLFINLFWIVKTENRLKRFFLGKKAKNLEDTIVFLEEEIKKINREKEEIKKELIEVNKKLKKSIRGLEIKRFNPFRDQGGIQSFAIAMQNEEEDGIVLSSLYSRERMSVYAKPIKNGKSEYELTDEEKEVIEKSKVK